MRLQRGVPGKDEPEHRRHQQQHGEEREQPVVRDQRGFAARLVVAELLHDGNRDGEDGVLLLVPIEAPKRALNGVHYALPFVRGRQLLVSIPATV